MITLLMDVLYVSIIFEIDKLMIEEDTFSSKLRRNLHFYFED